MNFYECFCPAQPFWKINLCFFHILNSTQWMKMAFWYHLPAHGLETPHFPSPTFFFWWKTPSFLMNINPKWTERTHLFGMQLTVKHCCVLARGFLRSFRSLKCFFHCLTKRLRLNFIEKIHPSPHWCKKKPSRGLNQCVSVALCKPKKMLRLVFLI